jgi:hypothetical protein
VKNTALKTAIIVCGSLTLLSSPLLNAKKEGSASDKYYIVAEAYIRRQLPKTFEKKQLKDVPTDELIKALNQLKVDFLNLSIKKSFKYYLSVFLGMKVIIREKLDDKKTLQADFATYKPHYQEFLGNISFDQFKLFLEAVYTHFEELCKSLENKRTQTSAIRIGLALNKFKSDLSSNKYTKDFVKKAEKGGESISAPQALLLIRKRLLIK